MANGTLKVQNIETSSGSGTITLGQSGETVSVGTTLEMASGKTQNNLLYPAFRVYKSSSQAISSQTDTVVSFDSENYDTDSAFASNTFTVPTGKGGKYFLHANLRISTTTNGNRYFIYLFKGTTLVGRNNVLVGSTQTAFLQITNVLDLVAGDTITVKVWFQDAQSIQNNSDNSYFEGFRIGS